MMHRTLLGWIGVGLIGMGCATPPPPKPEEPIAIRVDRIFPQPESLSASKVLISLEVHNPRSTAVTLDRIVYQIDTHGMVDLIKDVADVDAVIESSQTAVLEFPALIPFPEDEAKYLEIMKEGTIALDIAGHVEVDGQSGPLSFSKKGAVATPTLPTLVVHDAQAARYGEEGLDTTFFLRLINENPFTVTISDVRYAISIEGKTLKEEQGAIGARLPQGMVQEFEVSIPLDEARFGSLESIKAEGAIQYSVRGKVAVGALVLPFDHAGRIELASE